MFTCEIVIAVCNVECFMTWVLQNRRRQGVETNEISDFVSLWVLNNKGFNNPLLWQQEMSDFFFAELNMKIVLL